ncbi:hypothetical protein ACLOJK_025190 [Asimina triloba]
MPSSPIPTGPNHYCGTSAQLLSSTIPTAPDQCCGTTALLPDSDRTHQPEVIPDFDHRCSHPRLRPHPTDTAASPTPNPFPIGIERDYSHQLDDLLDSNPIPVRQRELLQPPT